MVSFSSMSFRSEWAAGLRRPGGIRRGWPRSLLPPIRVIERRHPKVHSQTRDFCPFRTNSYVLFNPESALDGPSGHLVEANAEDDGAGAELSRCRLPARCAREPFAQDGKSVLNLFAGELFCRAVADHAAPAAAAVRVVLVDLDADTRVLAEHRDLPAL